MSDPREFIEKPIIEGTPSVITLQLDDETETPVAKANIETVELTLYEKNHPDDLINGRDAQNILDANGGSLSTDGVLTLVLNEDDNVLHSQLKAKEFHVALIRWTWVDGPGPGVKEITYPVLNQVQLGQGS